jgi:mono/diheme cytochrome c family protein
LREIRSLAIALSLGLSAAGCYSAAAQETPEAAIQKGRTVAAEVCAGCHMATPHQEVKPLDPDSATSFAVLANRQGASSESLRRLIDMKHPNDRSPLAASANISNVDAGHVVAYILSLRTDNAAK